jgi:hypothetical protein
VAASVRNDTGRTDPDRGVSRRRTLGLGALVAAVYVGAAAFSAHLDPLTARPLLDGLAPPPAYQWVDPPPALASTNQPPATKTFTLSKETATYNPTKGSTPGVYATDNYQTTLSLGTGAIAPRAGADEVLLRIEPKAADPGAVVPDGFRIAGNVVDIEAAYRPTGGRVTKLDADAQLMLAYPAVFGGIDDTILTSVDGQTWEALPTTNHLGQQLAVANIDHLGMFAVGQTSGSGPAAATSAVEGVPIWVIALLVALAVIATVAAVMARRGSDRDSARRAP